MTATQIFVLCLNLIFPLTMIFGMISAFRTQKRLKELRTKPVIFTDPEAYGIVYVAYSISFPSPPRTRVLITSFNNDPKWFRDSTQKWIHKIERPRI